MKAVILAAGKGTRMGDLTKDTPKPLLTIKNKTLIQYKLDILPLECDEIIIIIGYLGDKIRNYFGDNFNGKKITYVYSEPFGTGYALWKARQYLSGKFLVMCGDDLYCRQDVENCTKYPLSILVSRNETAQDGGKVVMNNDGYIEDIIEGQHGIGEVVSTGLYFLNDSIFDLPLKKINSSREEYGLPQTLMQMKGNKIHAVFATRWHQITTPRDLEVSDEELEKYVL